MPSQNSTSRSGHARFRIVVTSQLAAHSACDDNTGELPSPAPNLHVRNAPPPRFENRSIAARPSQDSVKAGGDPLSGTSINLTPARLM